MSSGPRRNESGAETVLQRDHSVCRRQFGRPLERHLDLLGGPVGGRLGVRVACRIDKVVDLDIADGTRFLINGEPVKVFSGAGIVLDDPVTCGHYPELLR